MKHAAGATARVLSNPGKEYAIYLDGNGPTTIALQLPAGNYSAEWKNVITGSIAQLEAFRHKGGERVLTSPAFQNGIALRLKRTATQTPR
ncbi:MAG: hypothetical protein ACRD51_05630 [Candidatus Acidiferrum sp.]